MTTLRTPITVGVGLGVALLIGFVIGSGNQLDEPPPRGPVGAFQDGTHTVGADIRPGIYRTNGGPDCYHERVRDGVIVRHRHDFGPQYALLEDGQTFTAIGCGTWVLDE